MNSAITCPNCGEKLDTLHQEVEHLREENDRLLDENAILRKQHSGSAAAGGYVASKLRGALSSPGMLLGAIRPVVSKPRPLRRS